MCDFYDVLVVGGGVAGTSAAAEAAHWLRASRPGARVALLSGGGSVVTVAAMGTRVTARAVEVGAAQAAISDWSSASGVEVLPGRAVALHADDRLLRAANAATGAEFTLRYGRLCVATGARPAAASRAASGHARVFALRDAASVRRLARALQQGARRVLLVGNGGVCMEMAQYLRARGGAVGVREVTWAVREGAEDGVGGAFFDRDAAAFMADLLRAGRAGDGAEAEAKAGDGGSSSSKRRRRVESAPMDGDNAAVAAVAGEFANAVGPKWTEMLPGGKWADDGGGTGGGAQSAAADAQPPRFELSYGAQLVEVVDAPAGCAHAAIARLSDGSEVAVDAVVCGVGVVPATGWLPASLRRDFNGALLVDDVMRTSAADVYAAGDACCCDEWARLQDGDDNWFQWRLWSQALSLGAYCGRVMASASDELALGFNFELFTHVTEFLGLKVVLLGRYNGQGLEAEDASDVVTYVRSTPGEEFARVLLVRGRMKGAVVIGRQVDIAETYENLIADGIDLSQYGPAIMLDETHPDGVDLEDFFD